MNTYYINYICNIDASEKVLFTYICKMSSNKNKGYIYIVFGVKSYCRTMNIFLIFSNTGCRFLQNLYKIIFIHQMWYIAYGKNCINLEYIPTYIYVI